MSNVDRLSDLIGQYFRDSTYERAEAGDSPRPEKRGKFCTLRLACFGNPEKTIQGDLCRYINNSDSFIAVSESKYRRDKKQINFDLMIFDSDKNPVCAVQLKHFSRQQGPLSKLHANMRADIDKLYERFEDHSLPNLDVMLVGIYTHVTKINGGAIQDDSFVDYVFIDAYSLDGLRQKLKEKPKLSDEEMTSLTADLGRLGRQFHEGHEESFVLGGGITIQGQIGHLITIWPAGSPRPIQAP